MSDVAVLDTRAKADRAFFAFAGIFSLIAVALIAWLLMGRSVVPADGGMDVSFFPPLNAALNACSALCLLLGWWAIRAKRPDLHQRAMVSAFCASSLFLVGYLTYHYLHGDTKYPGEGLDRTLYLIMLASHVILSLPVVPMALLAFWFAFRKQFTRHKKVTRWLAPIWLYVSVTGVLVFAVLRLKMGA